MGLGPVTHEVHVPVPCLGLDLCHQVHICVVTIPRPQVFGCCPSDRAVSVFVIFTNKVHYFLGKSVVPAPLFLPHSPAGLDPEGQ